MSDGLVRPFGNLVIMDSLVIRGGLFTSIVWAFRPDKIFDSFCDMKWFGHVRCIGHFHWFGHFNI